MRNKMRRGTYLLLICLCMTCYAAAATALEQTLARDIISDPLRYQSSVARIVGEVVKVEPDPVTPGAGVYTVLDSSDTPIRVRSRQQIPKTGEQVYVVGLVYQEDPQAKPYIDELKKGPAGPPLKLLVGIAGILALIAFFLVYILIWHRPAAPKSAKSSGSTERKSVVTQVFEDDPVAVLSAVSGPHKGRTFNIYRGVTTIGREDDRTIQLMEDQTISRQQARILVEDGVVSLINESSTNPTKIGGKPVDRCSLSDGDLIQLGATKLKLTLFEE